MTKLHNSNILELIFFFGVEENVYNTKSNLGLLWEQILNQPLYYITATFIQVYLLEKIIS